MRKLTFITGLGAGYLLGARAGRERYESLMRTARSAREQPAVQEAAGVVAAQAGDLATKARSFVAGKTDGGRPHPAGVSPAAAPPGPTTLSGSPTGTISAP